MFDQAIDVHYAGNIALENFRTTGANDDGMLRDFDSDQYWNVSTTTYTLGAFWREARMTATGPLPVVLPLSKTGIYFQKPTPSTWGVLYLAMGLDNQISPSRNEWFFENIVRLQMHNFQTYEQNGKPPVAGQTVTAFDLDMTYRRFLGGNNSKKTFCPTALVNTSTACVIDGPYRDDTRTLRVILRNNPLDRSPSKPNTGVGAFATSRMYDLIYFFHPQFYGGVR